jgi:predicted nuclease of predicted toxin-antitoxin system
MKFLADNQLPAALARWLCTKGTDAVHVLDLGLVNSTDLEIWARALAEGRIVVSKDEDFFHLANRPNEAGQILWVRLGNCRTADLLARFETAWPGICQSFGAGNRVVVLL